MKTASTKVEAATKACILYSDNFGRSVQNANGLSLWFPADAWTYFNYRSKYIALDFAVNSPGWLNFLDAYFAD